MASPRVWRLNESRLRLVFLLVFKVRLGRKVGGLHGAE